MHCHKDGYTLRMIRGDTLQFAVVIDGDAGTVSATRFLARRRLTGEQLFKIPQLGNVVPYVDGAYVFRVPPTLTESAAPGAYDYEVEFTVVNDGVTDVYTVLWGTLEVG